MEIGQSAIIILSRSNVHRCYSPRPIHSHQEAKTGLFDEVLSLGAILTMSSCILNAMGDEALQAALIFLDSWLGYRARQLDIPGFSVAIYHKDVIVFSHAYGVADTKHHEALTTKHLFSMASQSKMFTATAILQLTQQGKLRLDDPAYDYIPWLGEHHDKRFREITIRQLLTHSAGLIRDGVDVDFWRLEKPFPSVSDLRRTILSTDIVLEPNTQLKYSNLGFALLGQVVETASREAFAEYVIKHIIKPIKLKDTFVDYTPEIDTRLATGYGLLFEHQRLVLEPRSSARALVSAIGIHATPEDICRFAAAHFFGSEVLLNDRLKREMQRSQWVLTRGYDSGMEAGLGLDIQYIGERRVVGHTGHLAGHLTATFFDPHERLAVTVAANCKDAPSVQIVRGIFEALDWFTRGPDQSTPKRLTRLAARLCNATAVVEVVAANQRIVVIDPDDWEPFTWYEELELVNSNTLRVTTSGSTLNEGELISYTFSGNTMQSVRYGGATLLPENMYRRQLDKR
jgi:D-alanyl-D-alanine carboxypeptidase